MAGRYGRGPVRCLPEDDVGMRCINRPAWFARTASRHVENDQLPEPFLSAHIIGKTS